MGRIIDESAVLLELGLSSSPTDEQKALVTGAIQRAEGAVKRYLRYDPTQRVHTEYLPQRDALQSRASAIGVWEADSNEAFFRRLSEASTSELQVTHLPVRATASDGSSNPIDLRIDFDGRSGTRSGSFGSDQKKTEGSDFWPNYDSHDSNGVAICNDGILRSEGRWPLEPGSVKVTYLAGYTLDELAGQDAIVDASPIYDVVLSEASLRMKKALVTKKKTGVGFAPGLVKSEKLGDYSVSYDTAIGSRLFGSKFALQSDSKESLSEFVNWATAF